MLEIIHQMPKKSIKSIGIKLPNKKCHIITIFLLVLSLFLTSCTLRVNPADVVVEYQVPFARSGHRWNEVELVKKDEFGRELYSYKSAKEYVNVFRDFMGKDYYRNAPVLVYLIVQKSDENFIYCYDNCCYIYVKSFQGDNDDIVENFKNLNDWGKPIDTKKLTALSINDVDDVNKYPIYSIEDKAVDKLEQLVNIEIEDYFLDDLFIDVNNPIYVLRIREDFEADIYGKAYVFNLPDDSSNLSYLELSDDINQWNEEIHNFKMSLKTE